MIKEVIILAGGLGTRLREAVPELPKCMAPVNGRPFITYVIEHFQQQGINDFIFALGYKSEVFESMLSSLSTINYQVSIEQEPLGTGGAIKLACNIASSENVFVTNGDTLYKADLSLLSAFHLKNKADCTLALKPMQNFSRYGVVDIFEGGKIATFKEKQFYESGYINGGLYALNRNMFLQEQLPDKFSLEKDYLEKMYTERKMYGNVQDEYFIDIGIPEDYAKAQAELS